MSSECVDSRSSFNHLSRVHYVDFDESLRIVNDRGCDNKKLT